MSFRRRLLNLARTEWGDVLRRLRSGSDRGPSTWSHEAPRGEHEPVTAAPAVPDHVARWYGNLELPVGASAEDVKRAYRRLVRRYHPDRHARDPGRVAVATQLSQELREAYEGLLDYLTKG